MSRLLRKRLPKVASHAAENGWEVAGYNGRGHLKIRHEETGRIVTCTTTKSDFRAELNVLAWMRRIEKGTERADT